MPRQPINSAAKTPANHAGPAAALAAAAGQAHQRHLAAAGTRKGAGAWYTPPDVVERLLDLTLAPLLAACGDDASRIAALRVVDPACGGGIFLAAAAERITDRLVALGMARREAADRAYGRCVYGADRDPAAVALCRETLAAASAGAIDTAALITHIACFDALAGADVDDRAAAADAPAWGALRHAASPEIGFDLVIGNPPFLSQLAKETTRPAATTARWRARYGAAIQPLTDSALLFLLLGLELARADGGMVSLLLPWSTLASSDAAGVRRVAREQAAMRSAWLCPTPLFAAEVLVWAPVLVRGAHQAPVPLQLGREFVAAGTVDGEALAASTWAGLLTASQGVPARVLATAGRLADIATATADFRDQYYGLRGAVIDAALGDDATCPRLVTTGLIDPARLRWGVAATRFAKGHYQAPRVLLERLTPPLQAWARARLRPKVLLATQTRALEAVVDAAGALLPSVPVVSVVPADAADLWRIGALLATAPCTLVAAQRHMGTGLSSEALRLSAKDVLALPLPQDRAAWDEAAAALELATSAVDESAWASALEAASTAMARAFGLGDDPELQGWWRGRVRWQAPGLPAGPPSKRLLRTK